MRRLHTHWCALGSQTLSKEVLSQASKSTDDPTDIDIFPKQVEGQASGEADTDGLKHTISQSYVRSIRGNILRRLTSISGT